MLTLDGFNRDAHLIQKAVYGQSLSEWELQQVKFAWERLKLLAREAVVLIHKAPAEKPGKRKKRQKAYAE